MPGSDLRRVRQLTWLGLALWLAAVLLHALLLAYPTVWSAAMRSGSLLPTAPAAPAHCRIVLVGSSPVIFGLSAADLQAATGCTAVNLGALAVGHVLNDYLAEVLAAVRPGDTVVLSDRLWTQPGAAAQPCETGPAWRCLLQWARLVPTLNEDMLRLRGYGLQRSPQGDLLSFVPLALAPLPPLAGPLDQRDYRLDRIAAQLQLIRARGARPLLAPVPVLALPAARSVVEQDLAQLSAQLRQRIGPGVWLTPIVNTDSAASTLDGEHATPAGRQQWTAQVAAALRGPGPP